MCSFFAFKTCWTDFQTHNAGLPASKARCTKNINCCAQVLRVWVDVRSGIEHLAGMVASLPLPPGHVPVPLAEDTICDVLAQVRTRAGDPSLNWYGGSLGIGWERGDK